MSDQPLVSVVIPNWNGARFLGDCLRSLRRQSYPNREVIVVDGASTDGSAELVAHEFPEVRLLALPENRGFAGNCNAGIRVSRGEIVALLNNDAEADAEWLAELVSGFSEPWVGACAAKVLLWDRRNVINSAGDYYRVDGVPGNRGVWEEDRGQYDQPELVFGGSGAAVAYRRAMLDDVGLLDERLFMYCEDVDLAFRAQLLGWRCRYVPTAKVYHRLSATGGGPLASYYCGRNFIGVWVKNAPPGIVRRYWKKMVLKQLGLALETLGHIREPAARARLRGQLAALRQLPELLRARRDVQSRRRVPESYILSIMAGER